jgi:hypothetical protein
MSKRDLPPQKYATVLESTQNEKDSSSPTFRRPWTFKEFQ